MHAIQAKLKEGQSNNPETTTTFNSQIYQFKFYDKTRLDTLSWFQTVL